MSRLCVLLLIPLLLLAVPVTPVRTVYETGFNGVSSDDISSDTLVATKISSPPKLMSAKIPDFVRDERELTELMSVTGEELVYLLSLQDDNGMLAQTPHLDHSIPYFSNMAALAMLSDERGHEPVRRYMDWYVLNINRPDRYGMVGTMYDWTKIDGAWHKTYDYDSADSYAATFLSLALSYTHAKGDVSWAAANIQPLVDIAEVLMKLQDQDGLIWAKPRYYVKFLMDNAENYRGLRDAETLMAYLGRFDLSIRYGSAAHRVSDGMEKRMWLPEQQVYAWAIYGRWWSRVPQKKWYPDTVGQIYPVVFGVVDPKSDRANHLYAYLNMHYPEWTKGRFDDRFPWTVLSLMAALMNDDARAVEYLSNVYASNAALNRGYPWHSFESAFFVKAWNHLGARHAITAFAAAHGETKDDGEELTEDAASTAKSK